jgi:hypothetical protein
MKNGAVFRQGIVLWWGEKEKSCARMQAGLIYTSDIFRLRDTFPVVADKFCPEIIGRTPAQSRLTGAVKSDYHAAPFDGDGYDIRFLSDSQCLTYEQFTRSPP